MLVRSLRRSAVATLSSSAPVPPPLKLRAVSCRADVHSLSRGRRPEHSLTLAPGLPGEPGNVGWPRTLRGAPAGHSGRTARKTTGRPSRAPRRSPGAKNKERSPENGGSQPLHRATCRHSPGRVLTAVRSLPRPRPSRPVDTKSMCPLSVLPSPEPPIPPEWRCRPSGGPRLKFGGKGGLRAPCGKDYPPNPPLRSGRTNWGVRGRSRALH